MHFYPSSFPVQLLLLVLQTTHLVHPIYSCCFPSIMPVVTRCSSFCFLFSWPKKFALHVHILFMGDFVVSAFCNTILYDFFAVHEIHSILHRNRISVGSSFFCNCFEIIQAFYPFIRMGSILRSRARLLR